MEDKTIKANLDTKIRLCQERTNLQQENTQLQQEKEELIKWLYENCDGTYDGITENSNFIYSAKPYEIMKIIKGDKE